MTENFPKIIKDFTQTQEPQNTQTEFKNTLDTLLQTAENKQCRGNTDGRQEEKDTVHAKNRGEKKNKLLIQKLCKPEDN